MKCPHCNKNNPLHTTIDGDNNPRIDDISFCIGCGELAIFSLDGLKKLDIEVLPKHIIKEVLEVRTAWLKINNAINIKKE